MTAARPVNLFLAMFGFAAAALLGVLAAPAAGQPARMELREIAKDVYVMQHPAGSSNSLFVVTEEGVVVFDGDIRTADQVFAAIRRTTDKKIRYYMISHPAGDHATGGWDFREDRPVMIASRRQAASLAAEELKEFTERKTSGNPAFAVYRNSELVQPDLTFDGSLTLRFGGLTFALTEEGSQHSTSDVTLYIPEKRVFAMGDLFKSEIHTGPGDTAYDTFAAANGWIGVAGNIVGRNLAVDTFVPGHGPVHVGRGVADLEELRRYFIAMRGEVSRMIVQGKSEAEVLAEFKTPAPFDRYGQVAGIGRFLPLYYRQLKAQGIRP